jgi:hypothetical protein
MSSCLVNFFQILSFYVIFLPKIVSVGQYVKIVAKTAFFLTCRPSWDRLGYTVSGWYIFVPPSGTLLLRRLQLTGKHAKCARIFTPQNVYLKPCALMCLKTKKYVRSVMGGKRVSK